MSEQSQILCRNACIDCGAAIPVPLRRASTGKPTTESERALHQEHRMRCEHCARYVRIQAIRALGNIDALKQKCMIRSKKGAARSAAARHARMMAL